MSCKSEPITFSEEILHKSDSEDDAYASVLVLTETCSKAVQIQGLRLLENKHKKT